MHPIESILIPVVKGIDIPMQLMQPYDGKWNTTDTKWYEDNPDAVGDGSNETAAADTTRRALMALLM